MKPEIKWEDDEDFAQDGAKDQDFDNFASLLEQTEDFTDEGSLQVGSKVQGVISFVSQEEVILDLGGKSSGNISKQELLTEDGQFPYKVGDTLQVYIISRSKSELICSKALSNKIANQHMLEDAVSQRLPIKGKILSVLKGGVEVSLLGKKGFCPISELDIFFIEDPTPYVGKEFEFLITENRRNNLKVSRLMLLKQRAKELIPELQRIQKNQGTLTGKVLSLRDFGAIVDIGGISGMVHISEISHSRVSDISQALRVGQEVTVRILKIEEVPGDKNLPRIGLSIKRALEHPWESIHSHFKVGEVYPGEVMRLEKFGAFVQLKPGIEGLIHVSEMSWTKRIHHPQDLLKIGDRLEVRILSIDTEQQKLSLSIKSFGDDPWIKAKKLEIGSYVRGTVLQLKPFGAIVEILDGITGLLPKGTLREAFGDNYRKHAVPKTELEVCIKEVHEESQKILLSLRDVQEKHDDADEFRQYLASEKEETPGRSEKEDSSIGSFGELLLSKFKK